MVPSQLSELPSDESAFPRRLGRYVLVCHLGEGGMGRVYLALARTGNKEELLVIKRFGNPRSHFTQQQIDENKRRFRREAQITLALDHPCIARTYHSVEQDRRSYLVQEFVHGMTLEYLNISVTGHDEKVPISVATYVVAQIARALEYLHDFRNLGLIHRDLTPSNVMLSHAGDVKVIDFGIAKATLLLDGVTKPHVLIGKPLWTAPELMAGRKPDRRADLYSLGLLFWSLLTGRVPVDTARLPGPATFNLDVSAPLDKLVVTAIDKNPERRFQTARQFLDALAPFTPGAGEGAKALAALVARCQPVLEKRFLDEVVSRGRPLLDESPARRSHWRWGLVPLPFLLALGVGVRVLRQAEHPMARELPMVTTRTAEATAAPTTAEPTAAPATPSSTALDLTRPLPVPDVVPTPPPKPRSTQGAARSLQAKAPSAEPSRSAEPPPPTSADDMLDAALEALARGDPLKAVGLARASAGAHPSPEAYILVGRLLFQTDPPGARAALENAVRLAPANQEAGRLLEALRQRTP